MARSEFRKSQGVVPFGVGAIIDFQDESLMSAGLDVWPTENADAQAKAALLEACRVVDGRLARRLSQELGRKIDFFLSPAEAPEYSSYGSTPRLDRSPMPFVRFPNWYFCPRCRVLKKVNWNGQSDSETLKCSHDGRRVEGKGVTCGKLKKFQRPTLSPVRFVIACENGHIMDFPWNDWAHLYSDKVCTPDDGQLYFYSTPAAGLAGVRVQCIKCNHNNSMAGAFKKDTLEKIFGSHCPGERPWLGPQSKEDCSKIPQTIQRGASNAYFADVSSSILIPPHSVKLQQIIDRPDLWEEIDALPLVNGKIHEPFLEAKAKIFGLDPTDFIRAIHERLEDNMASKDNAESQKVSEEKYRYDEFCAFIGPRPPREERSDFDTKMIATETYGPVFQKLFENIILVRKLRETRVLTGFSRLIPTDASDSPSAPLSQTPKNWLPGFSVKGEGIFLKFRENEIEDWSTRQEVLKRTNKLAARLDHLNVQRAAPIRTVTPKMILIHSFAHLLIRELAFECGYDSSSLRERLYISDAPETKMTGLLIFTASGDSEGTLGGLVRQGEPGRLEKTIRAAVENATICSSDPLCIGSDGQGLHGLNLSACHACSLLPETSCEEGNLLLDRALAVGQPNDPQLGFFAEMLAV